ncbi:MAG: YitT family protein [Lachnospiraceae bacterium]|nr:YitT family protein [Lachnospiraceae bacterium]
MSIKTDYKENVENSECNSVKAAADKVKARENQYIEKKTPARRALDYLLMTVGAFIYAVGISLFLDPNSLAPGGVTGISIILNRITNIETGTLILLLNIPILLLGTWRFGVRFILSTLYCIALTSLFTNVLSAYGPITEDLVLAAVVGGAVLAAGVGIVFKAGGTTGGIDIIIKLLRLKMPHLKTGALYLAMDAVVVTASAILFHNIELALYAGVAVFVSSTVLDVVLYGRDGAKLIYIISDHFEPITKRLLEELDLGVTHMDASGAYSGKEKSVIMCVCRKALSPKVEEIVKEEDPLAFMIVSNATEIYGEGYKNIFSEKL